MIVRDILMGLVLSELRLGDFTVKELAERIRIDGQGTDTLEVLNALTALEAAGRVEPGRWRQCTRKWSLT